jgi:hypothetical protein
MWRYMGLIVLAVLLGGCGDEAPGMGGDGGADGGGDADTDADTDADSDADTDADTDSDTDGDTDSDADADAGNDSGPAGECVGDEVVNVGWVDATITEPMQSDQNGDPEFYFIYTDNQNQGTAEVAFELPCAGTWYVWGIAQTSAGTDMTTANTFNVSLDGSAEAEWRLTVETINSQWLWNQGATDSTPWALNLGAGEHTLMVRGGESGWDITTFSNLPRLGPVVYVTDPAWTPPAI